MSSFELIFLVRGEVTDEQQDALLAAFDEITIAIDPYNRCTITGQFEGQTAVLAARDAIDHLHDLGHEVARMQEDLVDRGEIARRVGISRQGVGHWVKREQRSPFPAPAHNVPGEVWLWGDVVRWMLDNDREFDTFGTEWPCATDHDIINGELARLCRHDEYRRALTHRHQHVDWRPHDMPSVMFSPRGLRARWELPQVETYRAVEKASM